MLEYFIYVQRVFHDALLLRFAADHKRDGKLGAVCPFLTGLRRDFRGMGRDAGQPSNRLRRIGRIVLYRDVRRLDLLRIGNNAIDANVNRLGTRRLFRCHGQPAVVIRKHC